MAKIKHNNFFDTVDEVISDARKMGVLHLYTEDEALTARRRAPSTRSSRGSSLRGPDFLLEGAIEAEAGQTVDVGDDRLSRVMYARLVRKGGGVRDVAHGPVAGYQLKMPLLDEGSLCHGGFVGYGIELQHIGLASRLSACHGAFQNEHLTASNDELGLDVRLSRAWDLPVITLGVGLDIGLAVVRQRFETSGRAPDRHSLAGAFGAGAGANIDLVGGFYLTVDAAAQTYVVKQQHTASEGSEVAPSLAARLRLGVGMSL